MEHEFEIRLIPAEESASLIPLLELLSGDIGSDVLRERLNEMFAQGYECAGVFHGEELIGISGLWITTRYYCGRMIEPDNVVIRREYRGRGVGDLLMRWIHEYGKSRGCVVAELNAYTENEEAHRFYENRGYQRIAHHFQKKLEQG